METNVKMFWLIAMKAAKAEMQQACL